MMGDVENPQHTNDADAEAREQARMEAEHRREELVGRAREAVTGRPDLEAALERLEAVDGLDLEHHVDALDAVHRALREALASAGRDDAPSR